MRAVLVGAVDSTRITLDAIVRASGWELAAVVTLPVELRGRHSDFVDLTSHAASAGVPLVPTVSSNAPDIVDRIRDMAPDYIFVVGWSQICALDFMGIAPGAVIGYHPAALPRMRGRAAMPWTILMCEPITAGTLFWIDEGVDTGDILDQQFFHVPPDETVGNLYDRHMAALGVMLDRTLPALAEGRLRRDRQDHRCATWAARRTAEDGQVDWTAPAQDVERLIRAVGRPYPGAFTYARGARISLWAARPFAETGRYHAAPGQIIAMPGNGLIVKCGGDSALHVTDWTSDAAQAPRLHTVFGNSP